MAKYRRAHYQDFAAMVANLSKDKYIMSLPGNEIMLAIRGYLAENFKADNPNFKEERFIKACNKSI